MTDNRLPVVRHVVALLFVAGAAACAAPAEQSHPEAPGEEGRNRSTRDLIDERSDRQRADPEFLAQYAATHRFRSGRPVSIRVTPGGDAVLFLRSGPRSLVRDLYLFDPQSGEERVLLTAEQISTAASEELSVEEKARRERMRLAARGIATYQLSDDGERILVPLSGRLFLIERHSGTVTELPSKAGYPTDARFSPDGKRVACVRDGDLYVIDIASRREIRLTERSTELITHGAAEFVAQEEMSRYRGYWWSPDSRRLLYQETDNAGVEVMHIADPTHPEKEPQSWSYPRAGKANARVRLGLIDTDGGATTWVDWDRQRYPYLIDVKWRADTPLTLVVQNRRQTEIALLTVDLTDAAPVLRELLVERDPAWLNIDQSMPRWLSGGRAFLWTTERNGGWQLELRRRDGELLLNLTKPDFGLREVISVDAAAGHVYLSASADPTQRQIYRVSTQSAAAPVRLSEGEGEHHATFAKDHSLGVWTLHGTDGTRVYRVVKSDGTRVGVLRDLSEAPRIVPRVELTEAAGMHAVIIRPNSFDPTLKYPVIVYVYGGPGYQVVRNDPSRYLLHQWIADNGFVVVAIDGRGTPGRGRAWERALAGSFVDVPLADQVTGLRALGARYPELDLSRVGIFGWSYGGYMAAMAVLRRPEIYHAAVAGAPVTEWLDYDTHYTERFIGLPDDAGEAYRRSSALTYAAELSRPLLLIHGTADDNVYFSHSIKLSDALFRAGKHHEFLPLAGFTHMVPDPTVTQRLYGRIVEFFAAALGGPRTLIGGLAAVRDH